MADTGKDFEDVDLGETGKTRQWIAFLALISAVALHLAARFLIWPEDFTCQSFLPDEPNRHCTQKQP